MIKTQTCYTTTDGKLFSDKLDAENHQRELDIEASKTYIYLICEQYCSSVCENVVGATMSKDRAEKKLKDLKNDNDRYFYRIKKVELI